MDRRSITRIAGITATVLLSLALLVPTSGLAAQEEPRPATTAEPGRQPTYRPGPPAGVPRAAGELPAVGAVVAEDPLTAPGLLPERVTCPTGRNMGEFVGEGYILKVTGQCVDSVPLAFGAIPPIPDLTVPDGEIRLDAKVVSGHERAGVILIFRSQPDPPRGYVLIVQPAAGFAVLQKDEGQTVTPLARRGDLSGVLSRDGWNSIAVRLDGPNIWVLLNDEVALSATNAALDAGRVNFGVGRVGNLNDSAESAAVFRNLRVSRLSRRP